MAKNIFGKSFGWLATIALTAILLIGISVFLFYLGANTKKESDIIIKSDSFEITGMYGNSFGFNDVKSIEVKDSIPAIGKKIDGSGLGETKKGYFEVSGMGKCLLYISVDAGPYLYINTASTQIIMNFKDGEKTKQVYKDMMSSWNK